MSTTTTPLDHYRVEERARHLNYYEQRGWEQADDGGYRWLKSGNFVPRDIVATWLDLGLISATDHDAHAVADRADFAAFLARYREQQQSVPSDEEQFEMRAAFGPGVAVTDVLSGRRWTT